MLWPIFVVIPLAVATVIGFASRTRRWAWPVAVAVAVAIATECALIGKPSSTWEVNYVLTAWFLAIIVPWAVVGLYVWLMPFPARPLMTAVGVPFVYGCALVVCLAVGDISGWIPQ